MVSILFCSLFCADLGWRGLYGLRISQPIRWAQNCPAVRTDVADKHFALRGGKVRKGKLHENAIVQVPAKVLGVEAHCHKILANDTTQCDDFREIGSVHCPSLHAKVGIREPCVGSNAFPFAGLNVPATSEPLRLLGTVPIVWSVAGLA
jgi:hypothetical protein